MDKKVVVIDGQGGKIGKLIIDQLKAAGTKCDIYAIGTNSIATSVMMKAGADYGATGENPIIVNCRDADVIVGPLGIVIADSLVGEVTPAMATAIGQCKAVKLLLPVNRCSIVVGVMDVPLAELVTLAVRQIAELVSNNQVRFC